MFEPLDGHALTVIPIVAMMMVAPFYTSRRDGRSAQWRSSITSINGWDREAFFRKVVMESKRRKRAASGSNAGDGLRSVILLCISGTMPAM